MENSPYTTFAPRNFDEFLSGRGIFWFCDDSYKVTPKDMEIYLRETRQPNNQKLTTPTSPLLSEYFSPRGSTSSPSPSSSISGGGGDSTPHGPHHHHHYPLLNRPVYFNYPENLQPAPSPVTCHTPQNGSTSSLSSMNGGERHPVSCTMCRMPLCGDIVVCKGRQSLSSSLLPSSSVAEGRILSRECMINLR